MSPMTPAAPGTTEEHDLISLLRSDDPEEGFRQLSRIVSHFSREARSRVLPHSVMRPEELASENLRVARTIFGKWALEILSVLYSMRSVGFAELHRTIRGVTPHVLSYRLKMMETEGLVIREVDQSRPVRVRYRLSAKGHMVATLGEPVFLYLRMHRSRGGVSSPPKDPAGGSPGDRDGASSS